MPTLFLLLSYYTVNRGCLVGFPKQHFVVAHFHLHCTTDHSSDDISPGLTVIMVLELMVAAMPLRKLSKLIFASAMKSTLNEK